MINSPIAILAMLSSSLVFAQDVPSLHAIQGVWWRDCTDPAAEFVIDGNTYSGDFLGEHPLTVSKGILTFQHGLLENHGIHVSGRPTRFRILQASKESLVIRPLGQKTRDLRLHTCAAPK